MKHDYYIASRYRNKEQVLELAEKIRATGKSVYCFVETYDNKEDSIKNDNPHEVMAQWEAITDWRNDPHVKETHDRDLQALKDSETLVLLLPAGKSSHVEVGIGYGLGKKLIVVGEQKETESLYLIFSEFYETIDDFIASIGKTN